MPQCEGTPSTRTQADKPMVPTAPTQPTVNPSRPLLRHVGRPLGSQGNPDAV